MPKTKLTAFSRLLIFLLIALPIVYFGAAYYNGEDPVARVKDLLGLDETDTAEEYEAPSQYRDAPATFENVQALRDENDRLRQELSACRAKVN